MKKIPTLFERQYADHRVIGITDKVTPGMECVLEGEGVATIKWDGSCCAIIGGKFYKRYDAKKGKKPPAGAIPCCEPDAITGHHPHWVEVDRNNPADKWFIEAVGPHFQGNPYGLDFDRLVQHGVHDIEVSRSFEGIRTFLEFTEVEGLVFWKDGAPLCKIKRSDFGFEWPVKGE